MPIFKNRTAFEVARNIKVFLNLGAGVVRGEIPNLSEDAGSQAELEQARRQLQAQKAEVARLRSQLSGEKEAAGVKPEDMIWMFGMARTGSTWLSNIMGDLTGYSRWNEPLVGALFGRIYYVGVWDRQRNSDSFILGDKQKYSWLNSIRTFVLAETASRYPEVVRDGGYVVIKEPNGSTGAPILMEALPESRMIFLVRDPRDVVASSLDGHQEEGWASARKKKERAEGKSINEKTPDAHVKSSAQKYLQFIGKSAEAYAVHKNPKVLVKYEDLRHDTLNTVRRIFDTLSLPYDEAELTRVIAQHAWENIPDEKKGSGKFYRKAQTGGWQEDLTPRQIEIVEKVTAPLLQQFYAE